MIDTNLNYLLNNVHDIYPSIRHHIVDRIVDTIQDSSSCKNTSDIFDFNNMLLYGLDTYLTHMYIRHIIQCNFSLTQIHTKSVNVVINQCDITYQESQYFFELNLSTHLNKEKTCCIDFIKTIVSSQSVLHTKHLIVLLNVDMLNNNAQNRLRRIIEKSQDTSMFIIQCQHINKIIPELQSRFFTIRVSQPERSKCSHFIDNIVKMHTNKPITYTYNDNNDNTIGCVLLDIINNKPSTTFVTVYILFIYTLLYLNLHENSETNEVIDFEKHLKPDVITEDLLSLFEFYKKNKNPTTVLSNTRNTFFKILHYNLPPSIIAHTSLNILRKDMLLSKKQHDFIHILSEFEYTCLKVNPCKVLHCCEKYFMDIYCVMNNIVI